METERTLEAIEADYAALSLALNAQCLAIRRGITDQQRTGALFAEHPLAVSSSSIDFLRDLMETASDGELRERATRLSYACIAQFIRMDLLLVDQTVDSFLVRAAMNVGGDRVTFPEVVSRVMLERDFHRRESLREGVRPILAKAFQLKAKVWSETLRILKEDFGYTSYNAFCQEKKGLDMVWLARRCERFLAATDGLYRELMGGWVHRALGQPFLDMSRHHAIHLLNITQFDSGFPRDELMTVLRETLEDLGLEDLLGTKLLVDMEERPGKSPVSRCVPLHVPQEIHVIVKPTGGLADYEALLHEVGHGLHLGHTSPSLPYAFRQLPRSFALTECFAFLFQNLTMEPGWLRMHSSLSAEEIRGAQYLKTLKLLCLLRRYMGKFLFETELFSRGDMEQAGALYAAHLEQATGFRYEPEAALVDLEEEYYSADYLHAWMGESILRGYLKRNFGDEWFLREEAGALLIALWREGEKWDLQGMLRSLGQDPHDLGPLLWTVMALSARGCPEGE